MAARIVFKSALAAAVLCFSISSFADDGRELASIGPVSPALALAKERYEKARYSYEEQIGICMEASKRKLQGNPFDGMDLSSREMEVTAFVMAGRAMMACESAMLGRFAIEIGIIKSTAAHYGMSLPEWVDDDEQLLFSQRWRHLEKESNEYAALSPSQRLQVEQHPSFHQPFDFVDLLHRLRGEKDAEGYP